MPLKILPELEEPAGLKLPAKSAAAAFVGGMLFTIAPFPQIISIKSSSFSLLLSAALSSAAGIVIMVFFLRRSKVPDALQMKMLQKKDGLFVIGRTCLIILLCSVVNFFWKYILKSLNIPFQEQQSLLTLAQTLDNMSFVLFAILVCGIVPVAEELLFRRILYAGLLGFGQTTAFFGTAAVFAAFHFFLAGLPGLFLIGLGFQWLYLYRKNLTVSIAAHSFLNACTVLAVLFQRGV
jgi:membrane protease YdiL (CAAX protease family)